MFTGCIKFTGTLYSRTLSGASGSLRVSSALAKEVTVGDSVAVNGACLTVEKRNPENNLIDFHTLATTLDKTNLGLVKIGTEINLEQALSLGDRLDGHLVTGHVDCIAPIRDISRVTDDFMIEIHLPEKFKPCIVEHGSIAVDGISLTIASLQESLFTVHIIPYTLENTNLKDAKIHQMVNLEMDIIGKYVVRSSALPRFTLDP